MQLATRLFATLVALSLTFAAWADDARARAEQLATRAEKILNTYSGQPEVIAEARKLIDEALALDPKSGHAMVEKGRALLMAQDHPDAVRTAAGLFGAATQLDPPYGRGFVLQGHVFNELGWLPEAKAALTRADALVPNDPWLKLNWGEYYARTGQRDKQVEFAHEAIATGTTNVKALVNAYEILRKSEVRKGDRARADAYHAKAAQIQPDHAWLRGNYARDVITYFGDFEAGEKLAREALAIMDYGRARETLSLALYGQWAKSVKAGAPAAAQERLYQAAYDNDPGGRYLPECSMRRESLQFVFEAVAKKGMERRSTQRC